MRLRKRPLSRYVIRFCETYETPFVAPLHLPGSSVPAFAGCRKRHSWLRSRTMIKPLPLRRVHLIDFIVRVVVGAHIVYILPGVKEMRIPRFLDS